MDEVTRWDQRKFDEALEAYVKVSKRTLQQIVNSKLYYIARRALFNSPKADSYAIKTRLGGVVTVNRLNKKGKTVRRREAQLVTAAGASAPLAVLILQARYRNEGLDSPFKGKSRAAGARAMDQKLKAFLSASLRSVAFLKAGWLPSIKIMAPLADRKGEPPTDPAAKQVGRPKGDATPAEPGYSPQGVVVNLASARKDVKNALNKYLGPPLDMAFQDETASMWQYVEEHMKPDADAFNNVNR